jgi:hypothetical protein
MVTLVDNGTACMQQAWVGILPYNSSLSVSASPFKRRVIRLILKIGIILWDEH